MGGAGQVAAESVWGMPWHPALVHFPVAFLFTAAVLVVVRHTTGRDRLERHIAPLIAVGVATLPFVVVAGIRDAGWLDLFTELDLGEPLVWHVLAALAMCASATAHLTVRIRHGAALAARTDIALALGTAWLLVLTGTLAGEVVFG